MEFSRALAEIAEIHQQIAKGEVYRGYRSAPIAASGAIGLGAAWLQAPGLAASDPVGFVLYWAVVAIVAGFVGVSEIVYNYVVHDRASDRRRTRQVVGQFLPSMLGGAIITETIFSWPGIGLYTYNSISSRDYASIQGVVLYAALLFVLINLLVDILYAILDPRVRY